MNTVFTRWLARWTLSALLRDIIAGAISEDIFEALLEDIRDQSDLLETGSPTTADEWAIVADALRSVFYATNTQIEYRREFCESLDEWSGCSAESSR